MTIEPRIGPKGRDDDLTRALRVVYAAPPEGSGYWGALEAKILARIVCEDAWWLPFGNWVRAGLIAAGIALLAISAAVTRARDAEAHAAYRTVIETPPTLPQQIATEATGLPVREATLRYVIEH